MCDFVPYALLLYFSAKVWKKLVPAEDRFSLFKKKLFSFVIHIIDLVETKYSFVHTLSYSHQASHFNSWQILPKCQRDRKKEWRGGRALLDKHTQDAPL